MDEDINLVFRFIWGVIKLVFYVWLFLITITTIWGLFVILLAILQGNFIMNAKTFIWLALFIVLGITGYLIFKDKKKEKKHKKK